MRAFEEDTPPLPRGGFCERLRQRAWDVPDLDLEPPEEAVPDDGATAAATGPIARAAAGGTCASSPKEFTRPDWSDDCGDFDGEPPEMEDDPAWDAMQEEEND